MLLKYSRSMRTLLQNRYIRTLANTALNPTYQDITSNTKWSYIMSDRNSESDIFTSNASSGEIMKTSLFRSRAGIESLSHASLDSDFSAQEVPDQDRISQGVSANGKKESPRFDPPINQILILSSPETAAGIVHYGETLDEIFRGGIQENMDTLSVSDTMSALFSNEKTSTSNDPHYSEQELSQNSSPETATGSAHIGEMLTENLKRLWLLKQGEKTSSLGASVVDDEHTAASNYGDPIFQQLSMLASPETATGCVHLGELLEHDLKEQYREHVERRVELPRTMSEALTDDRPIVVTTVDKPFKIVDVNTAWVGLCGYSREEAIHKTLEDLLQGSETDTKLASAMIKRLKRDHYSEAVLINYSKAGNKFTNHVQVGLLSDKQGAEKYFVGVLNELKEDISNKATL